MTNGAVVPGALQVLDHAHAGKAHAQGRLVEGLAFPFETQGPVEGRRVQCGLQVNGPQQLDAIGTKARLRIENPLCADRGNHQA